MHTSAAPVETVVNRPLHFVVPACLATLLALLPATHASAQWVARGALAAVPVVMDCNETSGDVAVSRRHPPAIYLCPTVVRLIRKKFPGAEHFYLVHEYGHVAEDTADEKVADCWAAKELARAPNGGRYLVAVLELLRQRPDERSPRYGTPSERAERIRYCAEEERADALVVMPPLRRR